jgi:hypothetical protein
MDLVLPAKFASEFSSWMRYIETQGCWEDWMRQLDKDLGPINAIKDEVIHETTLEKVYERVLGILEKALSHHPQGLTACLYQTDIPEQWLRDQTLSPQLLTQAILWRTLQKVVYRKQFSNPA